MASENMIDIYWGDWTLVGTTDWQPEISKQMMEEP